MASGATMALTREPSARRASTKGEDSSTRRPTADTIFWIIRSKWRSSWKRVGTRSSNGNVADSVYMEIIGPSRLAGGGVAAAQQIRRDVPYLVR